MRRSIQPLLRRSTALSRHYTPSARISHTATVSVACSSPFSRRFVCRPSSVVVLSVCRSSVAPLTPLTVIRRLSTQLPTGGAPASPSASSSTPSLNAALSPPHPHVAPYPSQQQQPTVGAHPPHSSTHPASTAVPASVHAANSSTALPSSAGLPQQPETLAADAAPVNESRLRRLIRQYGVVAVGSYLVIYVSTLGMLYVAIAERWLGGYDIQHIVDALGLEQYMEHIDPRKGDFAVAWIATKFTEPLRLALTAAITPTVARLIGRAPPREGKGVRAKMEARVKEGVEQAKDRVEERLRERSSKH